jgi:YidC/Oxa1 family membrane protein insertase
MQGLQFFAQLTGDYGLAIILLTITVRIVLLPLTIKQTKSMQEMKRIQPKIKELQEKYKDNKEKQQEEMMKFYKEHKVNPLAGCLPLLLQLPIMLALFRLLRSLSAKDFPSIVDISISLQQAVKNPNVIGLAPYLVLVVLMIGSTYFQSKMMSADAQQDKMMLFMSLFMAYLGWTLPAGVVLYLVVTNLWTIAQQYVSLRGTELATEGG